MTDQPKPSGSVEWRKWLPGDGGRKCRLYRIWRNMKLRCGNVTCDNYKYYGARGIRVCGSWLDYSVFRAWAVTNGYAKRLELDRIDNDGNYQPSNCRWTTHAIQSLNRRDNRKLTFNGETLTLGEWAKRLGIAHSALHLRLQKWPLERALTQPRCANYAH